MYYAVKGGDDGVAHAGECDRAADAVAGGDVDGVVWVV